AKPVAAEDEEFLEEALDADAEEEADEPRAASKMGRQPGAVERHATVRYYSQMNPQRVYPLLVILSKQELQEIRKKHVKQAASGPLRVAKKQPLEIEPLLPGFA